jgi:hypothetical protein
MRIVQGGAVVELIEGNDIVCIRVGQCEMSYQPTRTAHESAAGSSRNGSLQLRAGSSYWGRTRVNWFEGRAAGAGARVFEEEEGVATAVGRVVVVCSLYNSYKYRSSI